MENMQHRPTRVATIHKCYIKILSVSKNVLVSVLFVDAYSYFVHSILQYCMYCDMLQYSVIYCKCDFIYM